MALTTMNENTAAINDLGRILNGLFDMVEHLFAEELAEFKANSKTKTVGKAKAKAKKKVA